MVMTKTPEVEQYIRGTNARLDALLEDELVFIINGDRGRRPVVAGDSQEALTIYLAGKRV